MAGTKRAARNMPLILNREQTDCFPMDEELLMERVNLPYFVDTAVLCPFTNARFYGWSVVTAQAVEWDFTLPVEKKAHQAVIFLSGCFIKAGLRGVSYYYVSRKTD